MADKALDTYTGVSVPVGNGKYALVDPEDLALVQQYTWHVTPAGYAMNRGRRVKGQKRCAVLMHRLIMGAVDGDCVDHINHDRLDNRRCNLRLCTYAENGRNRRWSQLGKSSIYKGVSFRKRTGRWRAAICISGDSRSIELGSFKDERQAAEAYNVAALKYFGEFAQVNVL